MLSRWRQLHYCHQPAAAIPQKNLPKEREGRSSTNTLYFVTHKNDLLMSPFLTYDPFPDCHTYRVGMFETVAAEEF